MFKCCNYTALLLAAMLLMVGGAHAEQKSTNAPEPGAPLPVSIQDGRIQLHVDTPRVAAYAIGDSIQVRLIFTLTSNARHRFEQAGTTSVLPPLPNSNVGNAPMAAYGTSRVVEPELLDMPLISVEGLRMGILTKQPSDVKLLGKPQVEEYTPEQGRKMIVVTFYATYLTTQQTDDGADKTQVGIVADYLWATAKAPDGQLPDWHGDSTPEFFVGTIKSAPENLTLLSEGDLSSKESPRAPIAYWLLFGSPLLATPMVVALLLLSLAAFKRRHELTKNEVVWLELEKIFVSANTDGFTLDCYRSILRLLKGHLGVLGLDTTDAKMLLFKRPGCNEKAVDFVFSCELWIFDEEKPITAEQHHQLLHYLGVLVPIENSRIEQIFSSTGALKKVRQ
jgi:hypothetical protein